MNFDNAYTPELSEEVSRTLHSYDVLATSYVDRTYHADMSTWYAELCEKLIPGAQVLDFGSGSGRDAISLINRGFHVDILEPSPSLFTLFHQRFPDFSGEMFNTTLQPGLIPKARYDAIIASASLLHIPLADWNDTLHLLRESTKRDGMLYISVKKQISGYDNEGRWFTGFSHVDDLIAEVTQNSLWHCSAANVKPDALGRGTIWLEGWFKAV